MELKLVLRRAALGMGAGLVIGAGISEATYFFLRGGEARPPQEIVLTIPAGTAERVGQGQPEPSLPPSMTFVIGDRLVVRNLDTTTHQLGPLLIPPGRSASLDLNERENMLAECSFQPGRYFGIDVQPPLTLGTRIFGMTQAGLPLGFLLTLYGVFAVPRKNPARA